VGWLISLVRELLARPQVSDRLYRKLETAVLRLEALAQS
jgi:hypothetical protein